MSKREQWAEDHGYSYGICPEHGHFGTDSGNRCPSCRKVYRHDPKLPQGEWVDDSTYKRKTPLLDPSKSLDENYDLLWQRYAREVKP